MAQVPKTDAAINFSWWSGERRPLFSHSILTWSVPTRSTHEYICFFNLTDAFIICFWNKYACFNILICMLMRKLNLNIFALIHMSLKLLLRLIVMHRSHYVAKIKVTILTLCFWCSFDTGFFSGSQWAQRSRHPSWASTRWTSVPIAEFSVSWWVISFKQRTIWWWLIHWYAHVNCCVSVKFLGCFFDVAQCPVAQGSLQVSDTLWKSISVWHPLVSLRMICPTSLARSGINRGANRVEGITILSSLHLLHTLKLISCATLQSPRPSFNVLDQLVSDTYVL